MKSIFWRIFLSFWLVMILILTMTIFVSFRIADNWRNQFDESNMHQFFDQAAEILDTQGTRGLRSWLSNPGHFPVGQALYVITADGEDLLGRDLPTFLQRRARMLRARPGQFRRSGLAMGRPILTAADGSQYLAVLGPSDTPVFGILALPNLRWSALLIAVLISTLACWVLTRSFANRLNRLAVAAESIAQGNLETQLGAQGNDEIGELARHFDRMANRLRELIGSRQELFRNVSHEMRSPLTRIRVALELATRNPAQTEDYLARIGIETEQLDRMMGQILDLAKLEDPATREKDVDPVVIEEVIDLVVHDARFESQLVGKEIQWQGMVDDARVVADQALISSAIENVIRNALQHTPPNTLVTVSADADDEQVVVRVVDGGPGIPDESLADVFQPFFREKNSVSPGTGLGLAITERAIRLSGGTIGAKNGPDGGLEVTIRLPRAA